MKKYLSLLLSVLLVLSLLAPSAFAQEKPLTVVTSFYPLYVFARNILKDVPGVALHNLTHPTTGCLHDYQLLATDMRTLAEADVLIINGGGMESFLDSVIAQFPNLQIIDTSAGITLLANATLEEGAHDHDHDEADSGHAHEEDHAHEEGHEHDHHDHDHGEYNAHIWLDPQNAARMVENMVSGLTGRLPAQADLLQKNLQDYQQRLTALDKELHAQLDNLRHRDIVTFHEAFPYFAQAYNLHVVAVLTLEPDEALTPQMLTTLVSKVKAANLPPLFTEPQYEDKAARAVAQETGAKVYELDPVVTGDGSPDAYEVIMRRNAQTLVEALGTK
jgi:zinc transport system substrate-binding protein